MNMDSGAQSGTQAAIRTHGDGTYSLYEKVFNKKGELTQKVLKGTYRFEASRIGGRGRAEPDYWPH